MLGKLSRAVKQLAIAAKSKRLKEIVIAVAAQPYGVAVAAQATALTAGVTQLDTDSNAKDTAASVATQATKVQTASNESVDTLTEQFFTAIESATNNDPVKLATTTVELQTPPGKSAAVGMLPAPKNPHATTGDFPGTADAHCDKEHGAGSYAWRHATDPNNAATYVNDPASIKSSTTITGLISGTLYYIQSAAIGTAGQGPWSDWAQSRAT